MPTTPHQRNAMNVQDAMRFMRDAEVAAEALNPEFPAWARRLYAAEALRRDGFAVDTQPTTAQDTAPCSPS